MKDHSLLVERYRSKNLNEFVGNEEIKEKNTILSKSR